MAKTTFSTLKDLHENLLGMKFENRKFVSLVAKYRWSENLATTLKKINPDMARQRVKKYVDYEELEFVKSMCNDKDKHFSMRIGSSYRRHVYGVKGDYSMLCMVFDGRVLTVFYRSVDLYHGLVFDQAILLEIINYLDLEVYQVVIMAAHAFVNVESKNNQSTWVKLGAAYRKIDKKGKFNV